jgi:hypothetical protein
VNSHFGESILPSLGKWANNLGPPVPGEGQDPKPSSLLGEVGLRAGSPSILTHWQLEAFLQDREDIKFEGSEDRGVVAGTIGVGEWDYDDDVVFRGIHGPGVEWIVVGEDGGQDQCRGVNLEGGVTLLCTCTVLLSSLEP